MFAGSGALGLEALSRGASEAVFIENEHRLASGIERALTNLGASGGRVTRGQAPAVLHGLNGPFDIIFLDPPFDSDLLASSLAALPSLLAQNNRVYLEFPAAQGAPELSEGWQILRDKTAGDVGYRLASWMLDRDTDT